MLQLGATSTLVSDYDCYYSEDPAINKDAEGFQEIWDEYLKTGDSSKIPLKNGQEPTRWTLRHIRGKAKRMLQDIIRKTMVDDNISPTAAYLACQVGLVDVANLPDASGKEFELDKTFDKELKFGVASEDSMIALDTIDEGQLVNQLGVRVIISMSVSPLS
jgi:hypothetical protein